MKTHNHAFPPPLPLTVSASSAAANLCAPCRKGTESENGTSRALSDCVAMVAPPSDAALTDALVEVAATLLKVRRRGVARLRRI